ncbi:hypothetical protein GQR58_001212 [Nymphon striatum]|nr:hypothetical protein GQR58_001212 [Nymphon striatum]
MYLAFQPNASSKIWEPGAHKKEVKFSLDARKTLHTTHISKMSPSTKCTKHFNLTRPQKIWEPGAHKKEVKFSLDARKTLHTTHIYKSIGIIFADNNAKCTHLQCDLSIPTLRVLKKFGSPETHKKELKFPLDAKKTLHTTNIS